MSRTVYIVVILILCVTAKAQELVPNGSFENITACPTAQNQAFFAQPWASPTMGSPDLYNSCSSGPQGVPSNSYGNQLARTGEGYVGCLVWGYKEYIQAPLNDTLEAGKEYCLTFYLSLPDYSVTACHNIGAYFSDTAIFLPLNNSTPLPFVPQIENTAANPLINKTDWMPITGTFIAQGTETHIIIGNFKTDQNSDTTTITPAINTWVYYYIDDVSLTECSVPPPSNPPTESSIEIPNVFTPNGDGINDVFIIESTSVKGITCEIFNRWGVKVAEINRIGEAWDGRLTSGQEAGEGVYFYVVSARGADGMELSRKGFLQLLR